MAPVLDALRPLVSLLGQAPDPGQLADRLHQLADGGTTGQELVAVLAAAVTDARLAAPTLRFAGVLDVSGAVTAAAPVRLAQAQVLIEAAERVWAPGWELVLTVPGFLRGAFGQLQTDLGGGRGPRETSVALAEVAAAAQQRLVVAAPFLHTRFVARLVPVVERVLSGGGQVVVITRALSVTGPVRSSANEAAVAVLRAAGHRAGHPVVVRSWEEGALGIHFKVVVADDTVAYLGSANLTPAGAGAHAEVGALVRGDQVAVLGAWLDLVADELGRRRLPAST